MAEYLALQASLCFALSHVFIRRGLVGSNALAGSFFSLTLSAVLTWLLAPFFISSADLWSPALGYFVLAGVFAPALGRTLNFVGIERIGVSRSVPVVNTSPVFASILAVFVLGEVWTPQNILGTGFVVMGVIVLSTAREAKGPWRKIDIVYPLLGAVVFAISINFRKFGLMVDNVPFVAAAVTSTIGFLFALGMLRTTRGRQVFSMSRRSVGWFLASGIANTVAVLLNFYALGAGRVVIVEPLVSTNPVISLILSAIFLRDLEAVTPRVIVGALCTVTGSLLVVTA
jgi:drug/metabolite transporter, DME family